MSLLPSSIPPPNTFCSPGLKKTLLRLGLVNAAEFGRIERIGGNVKAIAAICHNSKLESEQVLKDLSTELSVPVMELFDDDDITEETSELLEVLSAEEALEFRCLPISMQTDAVLCAMADPLDLEAISHIEFSIGQMVIPAIAEEARIVHWIEQLREDQDNIDFDKLTDTGVSGSSVEVVVAEPADMKKESNVNAPPLVRLVNKILSDAAIQNASDIHIEPKATNLDIRFRVDGMMKQHLSVPKRLQPYVISRLKLLGHMDITEKRRPQDGRFRMRLQKRDMRDVRVSSVPTPFGEKLVLRLLKPDIDDLSFDSVGMGSEQQKIMEQSLTGTDKIVIVTGPTGSGKSTTLYACANHLNVGTNTLVTVEDPIEFRIEGATQIEVNEKTGVSFAAGLRSILRQDPDVILVGEVRDLETAEIAFQAAQTGHLVLTSLHTNDAPSAVVRLKDLGLEPYIIAGSISAVVAQRLVRKVCPDCRVPVSAEKISAVNSEHGTNFKTMYDCSEAGCEACSGSGYKGRTGVFSILKITNNIREMIREGKSELAIEREAKKEGMRDLFQAAYEQVEEGETTFDEVIRVLGRPQEREFQEQPEVQEEVEEAVSFVEQSNVEEAPKIANQPISSTPKKASSGSVADLAAKAKSSVSNQTEQSHVLVVDDDSGVRAVMAQSFRKAGFKVTEAENGEDALVKLSQEAVNAIICDLDMPKLNGREFLARITSDVAYRDIPCLMLTGFDSEEKELQLIEAGASDFVSKTSSPAVVITRVKRLLSR